MNGLLVVDDEEGVRRSLKRVLEKDGYRIVLAENGQEALEIISNDEQEIDHQNSPGYRLILNNVLFPAAKKKKRET